MTIELWLAFVAASAILLVIPGPTILTVISYSVAQGRRANVPLVAAVALGDSTALATSLLGLGALLAASSFWFTVVKLAGGLYLLYLGVRLLRSGVSAPDALPTPINSSRWRLFANTYLVTALNPKGIVFFVAFLPQFVRPGSGTTRQLWVLAVTFVVMATINATLYAVFAASARRLLASPSDAALVQFVWRNPAVGRRDLGAARASPGLRRRLRVVLRVIALVANPAARTGVATARRPGMLIRRTLAQEPRKCRNVRPPVASPSLTGPALPSISTTGSRSVAGLLDASECPRWRGSMTGTNCIASGSSWPAMASVAANTGISPTRCRNSSLSCGRACTVTSSR